jgi:hypothetical protein
MIRKKTNKIYSISETRLETLIAVLTLNSGTCSGIATILGEEVAKPCE